MKMFVRLSILLSLMGTANAGILDFLDPPEHLHGTVGYVQSNHFVLVSKDAQYLRVFTKTGMFVPPSIVPGMIVDCSARDNGNNQLILESIDGVQAPNGDVVPVSLPDGAPNQ